MFKTVQGWIVPLRQGRHSLSRYFQVDEQEVAALLERVRATLPTTEVILIGKPQSGKSSIIRSLTGATVDIIGQGFRPHTAHTQQYAYPTADLPLIYFTDAMGLGEASSTADPMQELLQLFTKQTSPTPPAKVIILTLKLNDFATDFLQNIMAQIREQYPEIPCLLAITCLHELYPSAMDHHPAYPPVDSEILRAASAIQTQFADLCDRTVLIDFTLEEDGYTPLFYGLDAFVDQLADLLPEAEARLLHQLLEDTGLETELGGLYRDTGRRYLMTFSAMAATLAAVPLPFATMPALTALQVTLVSLLGRLYGQSLNLSQAGGVVSAIAGGFMAQVVGRELIKFVPGVGSVVAATWAAAYTWALGEGACVYFGDLMGGKKPDPEKIQQTMSQSFQEAKTRFKGGVWSTAPSSKAQPTDQE
ncbi:GTPase [Acaryochloris sp. IP29b_bin.148]|uniref:GTPase family protein n=1 Tax=Acaryochloris sp. IP29b_bin.148 TaxID=2969218 RepID=UPI003454ACF0